MSSKGRVVEGSPGGQARSNAPRTATQNETHPLQASPSVPDTLQRYRFYRAIAPSGGACPHGWFIGTSPFLIYGRKPEPNRILPPPISFSFSRRGSAHPKATICVVPDSLLQSDETCCCTCTENEVSSKGADRFFLTRTSRGKGFSEKP